MNQSTHKIYKSPDLNFCDYVVFSLTRDDFDNNCEIQQFLSKQGIKSARIVFDYLAVTGVLRDRFYTAELSNGYITTHHLIRGKIPQALLELEIELYHSNYALFEDKLIFSKPVKWAIRNKKLLRYH